VLLFDNLVPYFKAVRGAGMSIGDVTQSRSIKPTRPKGLRLPRSVAQLGLVAAFALLGLTILLVAFIAGYQIFFRTRIHRGVEVWNLQLGGLSRTEAQTALIEHFAGFAQVPWELHDGQQSWAVNPTALGIRLDVAGTVEQAFAIGRFTGMEPG